MNPPTDPIAVALGADRAIPLHTDASAGPLSWLQLREEIARRLVSAEQPSDVPSWDFRRSIPFRDKVWHSLIHLSGQLRQQGTPVSPDELAGILLDRQIEMIVKSIEAED